MTHQQNIIFVYGTLKRGYTNYYNFLYHDDIRLLGAGLTKQLFALYDGVDFPHVCKDHAVSQILGDAFLVDDQTLDTIDTIKGHPDIYHRELTDIILEDSNTIVQAWVYFYFNSNPVGKLNAAGNWDPDDCWPGTKSLRKIQNSQNRFKFSFDKIDNIIYIINKKLRGKGTTKQK